MYQPAVRRHKSGKGIPFRAEHTHHREERGFIEVLESRIAPAFTMTMSLGATTGVNVTVAGTTATYTAVAHGANVNWQDVENSLSSGDNIVISSGAGGTEDGNITDITGAQLGAPIGNGLTITVQSGSG